MLKQLFLFIFLSCSLPIVAKVNVDSLLAVWQNPNILDTVRLEALKKVAWNGYLYSQPDSTFYYAQKMIDFANEKGLKKYHATGLNIQGASYASRGDYDKAISYYQESLLINEEIGDKERIAAASGNLGIVYKNLGDLPKALEFYQKSLGLNQEIGNQRGVAITLYNIGIIYKVQKEYDQAMEYYSRAIQIQRENGNQKEVSSLLNAIGNIHIFQGDTTVALDSFYEALAIKDSLGDLKGTALTLMNIGNTHYSRSEYEEALELYNRSLSIRKQLNDKKGIAKSLSSIGGVYNAKGESETAVEYCSQSFQLAKEIGLIEEIRNSAKTLYKSYRDLGKNDKALINYEIYITMRDSLQNDEIQQQLIKQQYQMKADSVRVQQELTDALKKAEQNKKDELAKKESEKKNVYIAFGAIGSVLGVFFTIFILNKLRLVRKQKSIIEYQKVEVEEKNKEIMDSINYAKRIQSAILPPQKIVKEYLQESFILYKPKDIVAGDFYWLEHFSNVTSSVPTAVGTKQSAHKEQIASDSSNLRNDGSIELSRNVVLFAAADCTGHGVPGAMVSVICNNGLNRSVREHSLVDPGKILDKTRRIVISEFEKSEEEVKDGMDIALCSLSFLVSGSAAQGTGNEEQETAALLQYAGANNPLWVIRNGASEIEEIKADKQPIGKYAEPKPYSTHSIKLNKGDSIYIFSDGYVDQFGGEKGKKFKASSFKKLLLSIQTSSMEEQKSLLDNAFENWKGDLEQLDDVCVIGVRI